MQGAFCFGLFEQVANARRAHADEHLDELRAGDREERHASLAGHRLRQQRLAGPRRSHQQHSLGNAATELLIFRRLAEEVDDFLQLQLGFVHARDILKGDLNPAGLVVDLGLILAESQRSLHLRDAAHPNSVNQRNERKGKEPNQRIPDPRRIFDVAAELDGLGFQFL